MVHQFTLQYWDDDGWYVGKLKEVPGIFSQAQSLEDLETNIREVYCLMVADEEALSAPEVHTKQLAVEI